MADYPQKLKDVLADFEFVTTRTERAEMLVDIASRFEPVPEHIATRPYAIECKVPACESEAYMWADPLPDGTLKFYFAVENPQGLSAQAMAVILDETLSGAPLKQVASVSPEIIADLRERHLDGQGAGPDGNGARRPDERKARPGREG